MANVFDHHVRGFGRLENIKVGDLRPIALVLCAATVSRHVVETPTLQKALPIAKRAIGEGLHEQEIVHRLQSYFECESTPRNYIND